MGRKRNHARHACTRPVVFVRLQPAGPRPPRAHGAPLERAAAAAVAAPPSAATARASRRWPASLAAAAAVAGAPERDQREHEQHLLRRDQHDVRRAVHAVVVVARARRRPRAPRRAGARVPRWDQPRRGAAACARREAQPSQKSGRAERPRLPDANDQAARREPRRRRLTRRHADPTDRLLRPRAGDGCCLYGVRSFARAAVFAREGWLVAAPPLGTSLSASTRAAPRGTRGGARGGAVASSSRPTRRTRSARRSPCARTRRRRRAARR